MNAIRETFDKSERLCSTKLITGLFESGNIFYTPLFKVVWMKSDDQIPGPSQIAFSVSKKGFRLAVTRNLLKRRMREAFRKNKKTLYQYLSSVNSQIIFIVILKVNSVPDYLAIEKSMKDVLNKLIILLNENEKKC
jgi:ribonuclease P protein component